MAYISAGMEEIHRVLARPAGTDIGDVAKGRAAIRAGFLRDKLLAGITLEPGELFETMAGYRDEHIGLHPQTQSTARTRSRTHCKDCGADIRAASSRLKSDPARCIADARKKKAQYNANYRS